MNLPSLKVDLIPMKTVLLTHAHPGMDRQEQMRKELWKPPLNGISKVGFFSIRQESDSATSF
jgi:hypothetical protein